MTVVGHLTRLCPPLLTPTDELMVMIAHGNAEALLRL